ncbi:peptidase C69 [Catellatospora sp. TT07R-123]|uniref:TldD/PmbA family protein n=1 Tax=Catellatospora sp. TT07R-123 TaxID=2733863 RepID=UPI001B2AFC67|nr:TldD/PmbA family protein [Catellatospora sp. TT07R-123]GHJ43093.1 peptidase C69 [Catellatospora sp. TT07R-123]
MSAHDWGTLADDAAARAILETALDTLAGRVQFADARLIECEELRSYAQLGADPDERIEQNIGIGVRVLVDGQWGFAARPLTAVGDAALAARAAHADALAMSGIGRRVDLPAREPSSGRYATEVGQDPFAVDTATRHGLLAGWLAEAGAPALVAAGQAGINAKRQHRHYADTEGSRQHQHLLETGAMLVVTAAGHGDVQRRSYPNSFHGNTAGAGWEYLASLAMHDNAARVGEEAVALLTAPAAPRGFADVVIGAQQVSLQIHESAGHALELDRILGDEANYAGTSFIRAADVGSLRYGSAAVTIASDPTVPGTRGSFAFDDEGTPSRRAALIDRGIVANTLSTRDSAARSGLALTGAARSDGWAYLPVCFSTHVFLEPGDGGSLDDLLDRMGDGYYIDDNRSWSIDNQRLNFQFGTEVAYEVKRGRRGRLLRNFSYGGVTPQFWGSVEAVAGPSEFRSFGYPCGKGEPKQWGFLSHGASPMLVRDLRIGVA